MDQLIDLIKEYGIFIGTPVVFLLVVLWILRPAARNRYRADGNIPFHEDTPEKKPRHPR